MDKRKSAKTQESKPRVVTSTRTGGQSTSASKRAPTGTNNDFQTAIRMAERMAQVERDRKDLKSGKLRPKALPADVLENVRKGKSVDKIRKETVKGLDQVLDAQTANFRHKLAHATAKELSKTDLAGARGGPKGARAQSKTGVKVIKSSNPPVHPQSLTEESLFNDSKSEPFLEQLRGAAKSAGTSSPFPKPKKQEANLSDLRSLPTRDILAKQREAMMKTSENVFDKKTPKPPKNKDEIKKNIPPTTQVKGGLKSNAHGSPLIDQFAQEFESVHDSMTKFLTPDRYKEVVEHVSRMESPLKDMLDNDLDFKIRKYENEAEGLPDINRDTGGGGEGAEESKKGKKSEPTKSESKKPEQKKPEPKKSEPETKEKRKERNREKSDIQLKRWEEEMASRPQGILEENEIIGKTFEQVVQTYIKKHGPIPAYEDSCYKVVHEDIETQIKKRQAQQAQNDELIDELSTTCPEDKDFVREQFDSLRKKPPKDNSGLHHKVHIIPKFDGLEGLSNFEDQLGGLKGSYNDMLKEQAAIMTQDYHNLASDPNIDPKIAFDLQKMNDTLAMSISVLDELDRLSAGLPTADEYTNADDEFLSAALKDVIDVEKTTQHKKPVQSSKIKEVLGNLDKLTQNLQY